MSIRRTSGRPPRRALTASAAAAALAVLAAIAGTFGPNSAREPAPGGVLANGAEWPADFLPYGTNSIWNRRLPTGDRPRLLADSDAMVQVAEQGSLGRVVRVPAWGSGWDEGHPIVFARPTDPLVLPRCRVYCNPVYLTKPFRMPARARPADGGDRHLGVVQPDGTEIDLWAIDRPLPGNDWKDGDELSYGGGNYCGNFFRGPGFGRETSTVGGACLGAGLIRAAELREGVIRHALVTGIMCGSKAFVYPAAQPSDTVCTGSGPHLPNGAHLWLDLSPAQISSLPASRWEKAILRALNEYGSYIEDTTTQGAIRADGLFAPVFEDDAQYAPFGVRSPMLEWARGEGWRPIQIFPHRLGLRMTTWYQYTEHWKPVDWASHLHVLDPCYGRGSC